MNGMSLQDQLKVQLKAFENGSDVKHKDNDMTTAVGFLWPHKITVDQRLLLADELVAYRNKSEYTQTRLLKLCGFEGNIISALENGKVARVDKAILGKLGNILGFDPVKVMMKVCSGQKTINSPKINLGKLNTQNDGEINGLVCDKEFIHKIKSNEFEFRLEITNGEVELRQLSVEGNHVVYHGRSPEVFVAALKKIIRIIEKDQ